jgi:hypothetical protein
MKNKLLRTLHPNPMKTKLLRTLHLNLPSPQAEGVSEAY